MVVWMGRVKQMKQEDNKEKIKRAEEFLLMRFCKPNKKQNLASFDSPEKPYYVIASWSCGYNARFANINDISELFGEKLSASYDEGFSIDIYDFEKDKDLEEYTDYEVKSEIKFILK